MFILATIDDMYDENFDLSTVPFFLTIEEARNYLAKYYNSVDKSKIKIWNIDGDFI